MSSLYSSRVVCPNSGCTFTGGPVALPNPTVPAATFNNFINLTGANNWTLSASQVIGSIIHVNSGTNSTLYSLNLPSAASLYTALGSIVGATCSFGIYAIYSFNLSVPSGSGLWGLDLGNATGASQGVGNGSSGNSIVFNFAQNTPGTFLMPNGAFYQMTILMTSSTSYNIYINGLSVWAQFCCQFCGWLSHEWTSGWAHLMTHSTSIDPNNVGFVRPMVHYRTLLPTRPQLQYLPHIPEEETPTMDTSSPPVPFVDMSQVESAHSFDMSPDESFFVEWSPSIAEKKHFCAFPSCNKSFSRIEHLRRHEKTHSPQEKFVCDICDKPFYDRRDNFEAHVKTHQGTGRNRLKGKKTQPTSSK